MRRLRRVPVLLLGAQKRAYYVDIDFLVDKVVRRLEVLQVWVGLLLGGELDDTVGELLRILLIYPLDHLNLPVAMASLALNVHFVLVRRSYLGRVLRIKDSGQYVPLDALRGGRSACGSAASGAGGWHCLAGCAVRASVVAVGSLRSSMSFWLQGGAAGGVVSVALALASEYY